MRGGEHQPAHAGGRARAAGIGDAGDGECCRLRRERGFRQLVGGDFGRVEEFEVRPVAGEISRVDYLRRATDQWRALDEASFPFVHEIVDEFAGHDDTDQFRAGLDLLLAGLRLQAG